MKDIYVFKNIDKNCIFSENIDIRNKDKLCYVRISNLFKIINSTNFLMKDKNYKQPMEWNNKLYYIAKQYSYTTDSLSIYHLCLFKDFEKDEYLYQDDKLFITKKSFFKAHKKEFLDMNRNQIYLNDYIYDNKNECYGYVIGFINNISSKGKINQMIIVMNQNGEKKLYYPYLVKTLRLIDLEVKLKNNIKKQKKITSNILYVDNVKNGVIKLNDGKNKINNNFKINDIKFKKSILNKISSSLQKTMIKGKENLKKKTFLIKNIFNPPTPENTQENRDFRRSLEENTYEKDFSKLKRRKRIIENENYYNNLAEKAHNVFSPISAREEYNKKQLKNYSSIQATTSNTSKIKEMYLKNIFNKQQSKNRFKYKKYIESLTSNS